MGLLAVVGIVVGVTVFNVFFTAFLLRAGWNQIARRNFEAVEPSPDAIRRNFQSISINIFNFGWCVHIAVDEHHLHLFPTALVRLGGAKPMSIPWSEIRVKRPGRRMMRVMIGHDCLYGPSWALSLAAKDQ
jgi:hypothetical protein